MTRRSLGWLVGLLVVGGALMPPFVRGVLRTASFVAALAVLTLLRELVRLAAGRAAGLRPAIVAIGEGPTFFRRRFGGLLWHFKQQFVVSMTIWSPPASDAWLRARVALLAGVRPAVSLAVVLSVRRLGVPLLGDAHGHWVLQAVAAASAVQLAIGLFPFTVRGVTALPFESDGLVLLGTLYAKRADLGRQFLMYYLATGIEALRDDDPAGALAACEEGLGRFGPALSEPLRNLEAVARARLGDAGTAQEVIERSLAQDLPPLTRALALNNWSWYAFLARKESALPLADRRSAEAFALKPEVPAICGTRGAVLLWRGRVAEALPLLERADGRAASDAHRDMDACLLAIAYAARGESRRAEVALGRVKDPKRTDGIWEEAERRVRAADGAGQILRASRGGRSLVVRGDGVELHQGARLVARLAATEIDGIRVGLSARGRAQLVLSRGGRPWRLPLDEAELGWARMLTAGGVATPPSAADDGADARAAVDAYERSYQQTKRHPMSVSSPKGVLLLASAVAFGASMLASTGWKSLAMLMPVILLHELGHWIAMRAFGHRDARISFVPFFGAATFTKTPFEKRWQEIVMLLAGPLPGTILGVALLLPPLSRLPFARGLAVMLISINVANLLPLHPLDGGRIFHAVVTAGHPWLDLALKTIAGALFIAGGIAAGQPVLALLGGVGLVFWKTSYRAARLEARIRGTPGFSPRLPADERRAFIFRALADERVRQTEWAGTVAMLEASLGHVPTRLWQNLVFGAGFVACLVGGGLLVRRAIHNRFALPACPARETAQNVACGPRASGRIDWGLVDPKAAAHRRFSVAAFVWCSTGDAARARVLFDRLSEAEAEANYCAALPWEPPAEGPQPEPEIAGVDRRKARWTLAKLYFTAFYEGASGLESFDRKVDNLRRSKDFDPETAKLLRQAIEREDGRSNALDDAIVARVGRSPTDSCERLEVMNLEPMSLRGKDAESGVSFSVKLAAPGDVDDLAGYLCDSGCQLQVLPADPHDRRLGFCL